MDGDAPANARLRTLIHECAHALGIDYASHARAQAEVMVETVTLLAASRFGLAVAGETIPYVSGWGEDGALKRSPSSPRRSTGSPAGSRTCC